MPVAFQLVMIGLFFVASNADAQTLEDAQSQYLKGNYDAVIKSSKAQLDEGGFRHDWRKLLIKTLMTVGRYDEAYTNATEALDSYYSDISMRLLAREAALYHNDPNGALRRLAEIRVIIEQMEQSRPAPMTGDELVALGQAFLLLGVEPRVVLENCFQRAQNISTPPRDAFLANGQLALDKHDYKLAADAFNAGLRKFPDDPDMLAGLAKSYENSNTEMTRRSVEAALEINPRHIPSLLLLVDHLIDAEQYDEAEKQLDTILKVNPNHPEALAFGAAVAELQNDFEKQDQLRAHALKYYRRNPQVDHLIGRKLSEHYRFTEGATAQRRALAFEPDFFPAKRQLAEDLLRLGKDDEGWKLAREAHEQDGYDVTAYNLVTLHDQMVKYQTLSNAHFIVHMSTNEAALYGDRVLDLLERARETLTRKYGVQLTQPTAVEIFQEQKDFAVRTFGMPGNPGYLGVCFGSVITANSPASQMPNPSNWEDVLWHEFCHVITLTATKNRMPRWLSEGISVYEERQANPAWGDRMNLTFRLMIMDGQLTPIGNLSGAFMSPSNSVSLQFAYFESSLVIEFIVQKFGFDSLKKILGDLHDGVELNTSIAKRTQVLPELEKQFAAFAREQAEKLAPGADLEKPPRRQAEDAGNIRNLFTPVQPATVVTTSNQPPDVDITAWEAAHTNNFYLRMQKAVSLMSDKKWAEAKPILESVVQTYHGEDRADNPLWLLAVTQRNLNETNAELTTLKRFVAQESDFVQLYERLIELSEAQANWADVAKYADELLAVNPLVSLPYRSLVAAGKAMNKPDQAITAYRKLLILDPPDPVDVHFQLASLLHKRGDSDKEARRHVLQALEDAPRFRDAQKLLLEISTKNPQPKPDASTSVPAGNP